MKNKSVVAYCRSACEEPGTPSSAYSQARTIRRYAKRHGMNVREVYIDPGASGATLDRPALQRLIADCRAGKIGTVITKDRERLSRDMGQLFAVLHVFGKSGVHVEYSTREGQSDLFLETVISAIAEHEEATARSNPKRS